jgi:3-phenylpropionate/trans-cinnamate dioxygenase ferredoxin subunit
MLLPRYRLRRIFMGDYQEVSSVGALDDGTMKAVSVEGKKLLLARVGDKYYAADNLCPHLKGSLADGTLEGTVVTCPKHGSQFDLSDGHVVRWTDWSGLKQSLAKTFKSPRPIKTYDVKVEGDKVLIAKPV